MRCAMMNIKWQRCLSVGASHTQTHYVELNDQWSPTQNETTTSAVMVHHLGGMF